MTRTSNNEERTGEFQPPPGMDGEHFSVAWELAVNFENLGRKKEAVHYFILAAALLENTGQYPEAIYQKILDLDNQNNIAAERLLQKANPDTKRKVFVSHILSRYTYENTRSTLDDERKRAWVTPPRETQRTCPECGMGVPHDRNNCAMCGFSLESCFRKRTTAVYGLWENETISQENVCDGPSSTFPGGVDLGVQPSDPGVETPKPRVHLLSIDGTDHVIASSEKTELTIGSHPDCFGHKEQDSHAEEKHASIRWDGKHFQTIDLGSRAGIYLRLKDSYLCTSPRLLQIGSQTLVVSTRSGDRPGFRIGVLDASGRETYVIETPDESLTMGRSKSTLCFPQDPYLSSPHAEISWQNEKIEISDLSKRWGTFVKLSQEENLDPGTVLRIGRLLFRLSLE